ncbi:MAG: hypothetical protein AMJ95_09490 [Omnitrophica WOR_2 bacterium SM23_72]|nr:MAG: hypothetical protein AMJ95_09490 [Omnitrophica WOR_2 bacterium SM23_72]
MKTNKYQRRFYRDWVGAKDLFRAHIVAGESDLLIFTDKPLDRSFIEKRLRLYRFAIEAYIQKDRRFATALKPLEVEITAPKIIKAMAFYAKRARVGPMATVAGAIAQFLGQDLLKKNYKNVIIENGGDLFLKTTKMRLIGIYAGRSKIWNKLRLKIRPSDTPLGLCTSSGVLGHSLSFGNADSVTVLSRNACLADAVATTACNLVKTKKDLKKALRFIRSIRGVLGVVIFIKNNLMSWGRVQLDAQN